MEDVVVGDAFVPGFWLAVGWLGGLCGFFEGCSASWGRLDFIVAADGVSQFAGWGFNALESISLASECFRDFLVGGIRIDLPEIIDESFV